MLSEWSIRLRSRGNRAGVRVDRNSMLVVVASIFARVAGAIVIAKRVHGTALPDARWFLVTGLVLIVALVPRNVVT